MKSNIKKCIPVVILIGMAVVTYVARYMNSIYGFILFGGYLVFSGVVGNALKLNIVKPFINFGKYYEYDKIDTFTNSSLIVFGVLLPVIVFFTT